MSEDTQQEAEGQQRLVPVTERMAVPAVFEGRGEELHGVPMTGLPDPIPGFELDGDPVAFADSESMPDPIPVYIVTTDTRVLRGWRVVRQYAGVRPVQILGQNDTRSRFTIQNVSVVAGDRVWIADANHTCSPIGGYPLDPGATVELTTEREVYAVADPASPTLIAGASVQLALMVHYEIKHL